MREEPDTWRWRLGKWIADASPGQHLLRVVVIFVLIIIAAGIYGAYLVSGR